MSFTFLSIEFLVVSRVLVSFQCAKVELLFISNQLSAFFFGDDWVNCGHSPIGTAAACSQSNFEWRSVRNHNRPDRFLSADHFLFQLLFLAVLACQFAACAANQSSCASGWHAYARFRRRGAAVGGMDRFGGTGSDNDNISGSFKP